MTSKEIENLNKEISKIENRILTMETYLESHPDDFAVELSLSNLKSRNDELKIELSFLQENRGEVVVNEDVNFQFLNREDVVQKLNEQQFTIEQLQKENKQLQKELNNCEKFRYTVFKRIREIW